MKISTIFYQKIKEEMAFLFEFSKTFRFKSIQIIFILKRFLYLYCFRIRQSRQQC